MATLTSTACQTSASGFFLNPPKYIENGMVVRSAQYTFVAAQSAGDVIQMVPVPKGAQIAGLVVQYALATGAAITQGSIGDGGSAARYMGTLSASLAGVVTYMTSGLGYSYSVDDTIDIVVGTATSASVGGTVRVTVTYSMDQAGDGNS